MASAFNPFVEYLNSLRTQEGATNPNYVEENRAEYLDRIRAVHPRFPSSELLRIPTRVSNLIDAMRSGDFAFDLVFLTGDAGDGKTATCVDLARAEGLDRALDPIDRVGRFTIVKDASENPEADLREVINRCRTHREPIVVAINEGRLRRLAQGPELKGYWDDIIEPALAPWIDEEKASILDQKMRQHRIAILNFRHRMHVRTVTPLLLSTWTRPEYWENGSICPSCPKRDDCPILANVSSLRGSTTIKYVTDVLTFAHFSGQRLPFRRLQGILAFAITGALGCTEILAGYPSSLADRFYSLLFQREVRGHARPEPAAHVLAGADPGLTPVPRTDNRIFSWFGTSSDELPMFERRFLEARHGDFSVETIRALRRFTASHGLSTAPARWQIALELLENFALKNDDRPLLRVAIAALNCLHGHPTTDDEALVAHQIEPATFRDPVRATLELDLGFRSKVELIRGPMLPMLVREWLEYCPSDIELRAWPIEFGAAPRAGSPSLGCAPRERASRSARWLSIFARARDLSA